MYPNNTTPSTQERTGTYNGTQITFHPSRLGVLLERICLEQTWDFKNTEKGLKTKDPTTTYHTERRHYQDSFTYEAAVPEGKLELTLQDPISERIIITSGEIFKIIITRNPSVSKWRDNTRVLVTKAYPDGRQVDQKRFSIQDLDTIEKYVRSLWK